MSVESLFLECSAEVLLTHLGRIENCLGKLTDDQIWARGQANENAIGNLGLHLAGNVRQWILSGLGGEADHRHRGAEFAALGGVTSADLIIKLRSTVESAVALINQLTTDQLTRTYEIQGYQVTGVYVVLHVTEHFAQHTAQILFATKMLTGSDLGFYRHLNEPTPA